MSPQTSPPAPRFPLSARHALFGAVTVVLALAAIRAPRGEAQRPARDETVVARVPARSSVEVRALEAAEATAASDPGDPRRALALARRYIEASRREGDPRYLGAAEAALARITAVAEPGPEVRLLRATILQARHAFDAALVELDHALAERPDDAQAWLTRATVWTVKGNYQEARASCLKLAPLVSPALGVACTAPIEGLTGHTELARTELERGIATARSNDERAYLRSLLGERAFWQGELGEAERQLRATLTLDGGDRYTRALLADVLLDAGRPEEVATLLSERGGDDALALRRALADLARGQKDSEDVRRVSEGFAASRLRGDSVHQREEARLWLARGDAVRALHFARASWAVQHEAWDARLLLEAAAAANQPAAATPVLTWLATTGFESPRLRSLAANLREDR